MTTETSFRYFETDFISYYATELSETEMLKASEYDKQLITGFKFIVLPLSLIVLSNVIPVEATEQIINNQPVKRTWSQFAKDWTGISVLLKKDIGKTAKILQATRTVTGATSSVCVLIAPFVGEFESRAFSLVENTYAYSTITYGVAWIAGKFFKK